MRLFIHERYFGRFPRLLLPAAQSPLWTFCSVWRLLSFTQRLAMSLGNSLSTVTLSEGNAFAICFDHLRVHKGFVEWHIKHTTVVCIFLSCSRLAHIFFQRSLCASKSSFITHAGTVYNDFIHIAHVPPELCIGRKLFNQLRASRWTKSLATGQEPCAADTGASK